MMGYKARRLPEHLGRAGWNAILGDAPPPRPLEADATADFAVIGAGFAGLSAARRLATRAPGARIAVLEAGRIAESTAGRNSGFMIDLPHELTSEDYAGAGDDKAIIALNREAQTFARDAVEAYAIRRDFFDPAGKVNGAASAAADAHNRSYAAHLAALGEPCEMLDAQAMRDLTGSRHYRSGLFTPGTVMLQPAGYIRGLAAGLAQGGVAVHENSPVTGFTRAGDTWTLTTPKARLTAGKVILAVNGHLESFGVEPGRLMQIFLYAVMTPELDVDQLARVGGQSRWGITPSDPMGTTVRRIDPGQGGHRIVTRTCATLKPGMVPTRQGLQRAARIMQRKFDSRFPALAGLRMEHAWAGHLCLTMNSVSVMREIEAGLYSAAVQNGLGTARGTLTGIGAADLALGQTSEITRHFSAEPRPTRLVPRPLLDIGANAVLRLRERRARQE
ncbi:MAG TPA: FAD-dependent oxidoreductase [Rhodobacteraceae bacterium]|nr:FAD-dependent oxidoreductase [Paracoccaceae bacterium]